VGAWYFLHAVHFVFCVEVSVQSCSTFCYLLRIFFFLRIMSTLSS
jgi:hypothetical protein